MVDSIIHNEAPISTNSNQLMAWSANTFPTERFLSHKIASVYLLEI